MKNKGTLLMGILLLFPLRLPAQEVAGRLEGRVLDPAGYYALRAVSAAQPANAEAKIAKELHWQSRRLPKDLRRGWQDWQSRRLPKNLKQVWRDVFTAREKG